MPEHRATVTDAVYATGLQATAYPQAGEEACDSDGGAETPSLMSLLLVRLMTIFFQPQDSASFATHSAVFMPIFKFVVKFQWFECEPVSIKNPIGHIKCNCTHKTLTL